MTPSSRDWTLAEELCERQSNGDDDVRDAAMALSSRFAEGVAEGMRRAAEKAEKECGRNHTCGGASGLLGDGCLVATAIRGGKDGA